MARRRGRRYAYGPYVDGPDPLAPPVDLRAALDEIGRDVMEGSSPRSALQELLRRGLGERRGLDDLTREVWQRRSRLQRDNRLDGTLQEVRELLRRALEAERDGAGPTRTPTTPGSARCSSTRCRPTPAARSASWTPTTGARPRPARPTRRSATCSAGRCSTSASPGMKQAMQNVTPQDVERIRQMLDDLNSLLANHAAGQDTQEQFQRVHARSTASSSRRTRRTPTS